MSPDPPPPAYGEGLGFKTRFEIDILQLEEPMISLLVDLQFAHLQRKNAISSCSHVTLNQCGLIKLHDWGNPLIRWSTQTTYIKNTQSIPTHWELTKWELTKWEVTKWELTKWELTKWELTKWELTKWE